MIPVLAISLQPLAFFTILARPVTRQNLSKWRLGGCQEWLARQDLLAPPPNWPTAAATWKPPPPANPQLCPIVPNQV
jgi:hypothetical protein